MSTPGEIELIPPPDRCPGCMGPVHFWQTTRAGYFRDQLYISWHWRCFRAYGIGFVDGRKFAKEEPQFTYTAPVGIGTYLGMTK